jgi:RimJ/RimL family protein N-acetyltransferase
VAVIEEDLANNVCFIELALLELYRGQRLGSVAARMLTRKCFEELDARRVESSALSSNPASVHMQDEMTLEGTLKSRFVIDGEVIDELLFGCLRRDWEIQQEIKRKLRLEVLA